MQHRLLAFTILAILLCTTPVSAGRPQAGGGCAPSASDLLLHRRAPLPSRRGLMLNQINLAARGLIGVPYVFGGTSAHGIDCSGFTQRVYAVVGIRLRRMADEQYYQGKPSEPPQAGDLVFFSTYLPGPSHVGIYLGGGLFIHASCRRGVTITSLSDPWFKNRFLGARSFF